MAFRAAVLVGMTLIISQCKGQQNAQQLRASQAQLLNINADLLGVQTNAQYRDQPTKAQNPIIWSALDVLRGTSRHAGALRTDEMQEILARAVPGQDYPVYSTISLPHTTFSCEQVNQPGFYADVEAQCQVIRRCDVNSMMWTYLCPNGTLFNQLTLTCDWYFNIDCSQVKSFYDYSNSRLYHSNLPLLDDGAMPVYDSGPVQTAPAPSAPVVYRPPVVNRPAAVSQTRFQPRQPVAAPRPAPPSNDSDRGDNDRGDNDHGDSDHGDKDRGDSDHGDSR